MNASRDMVVYARNRGSFLVRAYSARHAIAIVVARLALSEREADEVCAWCVTDNPRAVKALWQRQNGNAILQPHRGACRKAETAKTGGGLRVHAHNLDVDRTAPAILPGASAPRQGALALGEQRPEYEKRH